MHPCCPHCKTALRSADTGLACTQCRGRFCDKAALKSLIDAACASAPSGKYKKPPLDISKAVRYVPCPTCSQLMNRRNFGDASGVVVDVCSKHGVWFDQGELLQVLSFCSTGELARATAASAERQAARHRLDAFSARVGTPETGEVVRYSREEAVADAIWFAITSALD